jgi:hypothetical protein
MSAVAPVNLSREQAPIERALGCALIGGDLRLQQMLERVFEGPGKGTYRIVPFGMAQALIVHLDTEGAIAQWRSLNADPEVLPTVFISTSFVEPPPGALFLLKPVLLNELLVTLARLRRLSRIDDISGEVTLDEDALAAAAAADVRPSGAIAAIVEARSIMAQPPLVVAPIEEACADPAHAFDLFGCSDPAVLVGACPDIDLALGEAPANAFTALQGTLLAHALRAYEQSTSEGIALEVRVREEPVFALLPEQRLAALLIDEHRVARMCRDRTFASIAVRPLNANRLAAAFARAVTDRARMRRPEELIYSIGAHTFRGRLPEDTDVHAPVFLRAWPNLTRVPRLPDAMRIASVWTRTPLSLLRTADTLAIPQRHVFAFYAACWSAGLAGPSRRVAEVMHARAARAEAAQSVPRSGRFESEINA